jgi:hypothetical protein
MRIRLEDGFREIEILGRSDLVEFYSPELAMAFLRRLLREPGNRAALRNALSGDSTPSGLFALDDEAVLRELARRVVHGDLKIVARRPLAPGHNATPPGESQGSTPRQDEQAAKQEQAAAAAVEDALAEDEPAEEAADPLLEGTDTEAQAAALQDAASTGTPLCEA